MRGVGHKYIRNFLFKYTEGGGKTSQYLGVKNQRKLFLYNVFRWPFGSWTSGPKIVDVRTKQCVFLRPWWWRETFRPLGIRAGMSAGNPHQKVYVYAVFSFPEIYLSCRYLVELGCRQLSDRVKRHLCKRHLSVLNLKFDFIFDGGCTREEQIAPSLKRHLFPHAGRKPKAFWIYSSTLPF